MENNLKFILYKKLLIFGASDSGKSTLTFMLENNGFADIQPSEEGKKINNLINNIYIFFSIYYYLIRGCL